MITNLRAVIDSACPAFLLKFKLRVEASPIGYRLARGAFWSLVGTVLSRSLGVVSSIFVARMLGKIGVGQLGIIQSTVGIFTAFAGLGMGISSTKFIAEYRRTDPEQAGSMLGISAIAAWGCGAIMTIAMMILAPWFAEHTIAAPQLSGLIRIGSALLFLGSINGAQTGALAGFEAFKSIAWINLICGLLTFPLMVGGAWGFGLTGAVWGLVGSMAVNCVFSHLALRREAAAAGVPIIPKMRAQQWRVLWHFGLPSVLCEVIWGPLNWACCALLVNQPNGYSEMGVFNIGMSWFNAVSFLPGVLGRVILPLLSSESGKSGDGKQKKIVYLGLITSGLSIIPVALLVSALSPFIMALYGRGFREGWPTLVLLVIGAVCLALQNTLSQAITAAGRMWIVFLTFVTYGAIYLGLSFVMLRWAHWGALGLATARCAAYLINGLVTWWLAREYLRPKNSEWVDPTKALASA
jgi:O-antigen/teichoic acid export membrane protein